MGYKLRLHGPCTTVAAPVSTGVSAARPVALDGVSGCGAGIFRPLPPQGGSKWLKVTQSGPGRAAQSGPRWRNPVQGRARAQHHAREIKSHARVSRAWGAHARSVVRAKPRVAGAATRFIPSIRLARREPLALAPHDAILTQASHPVHRTMVRGAGESRPFLGTPSTAVALRALSRYEELRCWCSCGRGGSGRRAGLKNPFLRECEFESHRPHQAPTMSLTAAGLRPAPARPVASPSKTDSL